jgi:aspartyl protease family protein
MKIIIVVITTAILLSVSIPLHAQPSAWKGLSDGISQGLENARRMQEMELMREQRRLMEEQRRQLEEQRLYNEEQRRIQEEKRQLQIAQEEKMKDCISYLDRNVPDWTEILKDPDFKEWLNENGKRHSLNRATEELDAYKISLIINEYKELLERKRTSTTLNPNEVKLVKNGGVYEVPVILNNALSIHFILDSGASDISISSDVALTLMKTKTIKKKDWLPGATYKFADGSRVSSKRFKLKSVKIGNVELTNVTCSISNSMDAPMLLGQSALQKLRRYTIDYDKNVLIFNVSEEQAQADLKRDGKSRR